jgi:hypothetical protein
MGGENLIAIWSENASFINPFSAYVLTGKKSFENACGEVVFGSRRRGHAHLGGHRKCGYGGGAAG